MKRLNPIPDEVLEKHHAFYSGGIQHALARLAAGQRVEFAESEEDEKNALKEQEVLGDPGVRQYFQSIRDLFVKNSLLKATAIQLRRIVSTQIPSFSSTKSFHALFGVQMRPLLMTSVPCVKFTAFFMKRICIVCPA